MATRAYVNNPNGQNSSGEIQALFDQVVRLESDSPSEDTLYVGSEVYGQDDLGLNTEGRAIREVFAHTGLLGRSDLKEDIVRQEYSAATYETGSLTISGMARIGKTHFYYLEDQEDRPQDMRFAVGHAQDLPRLQRKTEEYHRMLNYVNGETWTGGFHKTPLFVDGVNHQLQLLGRPDYFSDTAASNIMDWFGGVGYAMIMQADSFGDSHVNQEGERSQIYVTHILTGSYSNADLLQRYYTSTYNIDTNNPNAMNPRDLVYGGGGRRRQVPTILVSDELGQANPNDVIFYYNGWMDDIKEFTRYENRIDTWEDGNAQFRKVVTQIRSRIGHYFKENRRVLLMRGPRVN